MHLSGHLQAESSHLLISSQELYQENEKCPWLYSGDMKAASGFTGFIFKCLYFP